MGASEKSLRTIQRCKRSVNGGRNPLRGFFPQAPFFLTFGRLGEFRSLLTGLQANPATRALPSTRKLFKKSLTKNFE